MPANKKPGIDWAAIEVRVRAGESYRSIAHDFDVSHVAISKQAKRNGWKPSPHDRWLTLTAKSKTAEMLKSPQTEGEKKIAAYGKRTPENAAQILAYLEDGASISLAAKSVGIDPRTLAKWQKDDPYLNALIVKARAEHLSSLCADINKAAKRGDWRAAAKLLEVAPETKHEWNPERTGHANINVILNIPRAPGDGAKVIDGIAGDG